MDTELVWRLTYGCLNAYRVLTRTQDALKEVLNQETEEALFEYHRTKEDRWPAIKSFRIELNHQNFHHTIARIIAMPPGGTPSVASDQEADAIDNFFQKILKQRLPDQDNLKIEGHIHMFVTAPKSFRK